MWSHNNINRLLLTHTNNHVELLIAEHKQGLQRTGKLPTDESYLTTTERPHPLTRTLSQDAQGNLRKAIRCLQKVDVLALETLSASAGEKFALFKQEAQRSLSKGHKIFISGCGAAGRAAVLIERMVARHFPAQSSQIISIIAGGEASLVKSAEGFEDNAGYGKKQLLQMGWQPGDLLVGLSASGSAPFIHGQLEYVVENSDRKPFFFYCNTDDEVEAAFSEKTIFKDKKIHTAIHFVSIVTGEMGLAGSTRMQAATAQTLLALPLMNLLSSFEEKIEEDQSTASFIKTLSSMLKNMELHRLEDLIKKEAEIYKKKGHVIYYVVPPEHAQNVLTDTTERAPTFSQNYFENELDDAALKKEKPSKVRLLVDGTLSSEEAWHQMLGRPPIALNWPEVPHTSIERIYGYDLSKKITQSRPGYTPTLQSHFFSITLEETNQLTYKLDHLTASFDLKAISHLPPYLKDLAIQLVSKMTLNIHSTLVMGIRDCYYSNQMTYVKPSNFKLINRAASGIYHMLHDPVGPTSKIFPLAAHFFKQLSRYTDLDALLMYVILDELYKAMLKESLIERKPASRSVTYRVSYLLAKTAQIKLEEKILQNATEIAIKSSQLNECPEEKILHQKVFSRS